MQARARDTHNRTHSAGPNLRATSQQRRAIRSYLRSRQNSKAAYCTAAYCRNCDLRIPFPTVQLYAPLARAREPRLFGVRLRPKRKRKQLTGEEPRGKVGNSYSKSQDPRCAATPPPSRAVHRVALRSPQVSSRTCTCARPQAHSPRPEPAPLSALATACSSLPASVTFPAPAPRTCILRHAATVRHRPAGQPAPRTARGAGAPQSVNVDSAPPPRIPRPPPAAQRAVAHAREVTLVGAARICPSLTAWTIRRTVVSCSPMFEAYSLPV